MKLIHRLIPQWSRPELDANRSTAFRFLHLRSVQGPSAFRRYRKELHCRWSHDKWLFLPRYGDLNHNWVQSPQRCVHLVWLTVSLLPEDRRALLLPLLIWRHIFRVCFKSVSFNLPLHYFLISTHDSRVKEGRFTKTRGGENLLQRNQM